MTSVPTNRKRRNREATSPNSSRSKAKLALREPTGLGMGIGAPIILLVVFGLIGIANPGNVAGTGLTVIDLYVPTIMVIGFIFLGIYYLACHPGEVSGDGVATKSFNDSRASFETTRSSIDHQPCACLGRNLDRHLWKRINLRGAARRRVFRILFSQSFSRLR